MSKVWSWYKNRVIQYQILQSVNNRETFFKDAEGKMHLRPLHIFSMQGIEYAISSTGYYKRKFNFFSSAAHLDWTKFKEPPKDKTLWKDYRKEFNNHFEEMVAGYDFVIDIDNDDIDKAYKIASNVKLLFDDLKLPYFIVFSGAKGFHFKVDWRDLELGVDLKTLVETTKNLAERISKLSGFEFGSDIDSIYDLRRMIRVPYSIHPKTGAVVLPLSDEQFNDFVPGDYSIENVLKKVHLKNRGFLKRNLGVPRSSVKSSLNDFLVNQ